jgi:hypothetical protein
MTDVPASPDGPNTDRPAPDPVPALPFTPIEQAQLLADDLHAARVVAGLMAVIFALGLVLYVVVLITTL